MDNLSGKEVVDVGCDLCSLKRFRALMSSYRDDELSLLFSSAELGYYKRGYDRLQGLAIAFAAKESVGKCLGVGFGGINYKDIEIFTAGDDLKIFLYHRAKKIAARLQITKIQGSWRMCRNELIAAYIVGIK